MTRPSITSFTWSRVGMCSLSKSARDHTLVLVSCGHAHRYWSLRPTAKKSQKHGCMLVMGWGGWPGNGRVGGGAD